MDELNLSALLGAITPGPDAQLDAMRKMGLLGQLSGDRVLAPVGQGLVQQATRGQDAATQRQGDALRLALQQRQQAAQQAHQQALLAQQQAEQAANERYRQQQLGLQGQELGLKRQSLDQDAWAFGQDATGGGFMYNRKTGQVVPVGAPGGRPPPGQGTGLKPQQFEADVQSLGKDTEPLAKAAPDIQLLENATKPEDVAGFGPVAGRVPNLLMSDEGVKNRQAAGRLMAAIIQATSGQAASEKEVDRLLEANGMGRTATTPQLRLGISKLKAQYDNLLKQKEAKYLPQVVDTFGERGGYTSRTRQNVVTDTASPPKRIKVDADGNIIGG